MQNQKNDAVETAEQNTSERKFSGNDIKTILKTALILIIITAVTSGALAALNSLTTPVIEERLLKEKNLAVEELFGNGISFDKADYEFSGSVTELLIVKGKDGDYRGYCVSASPKGFGGNIDLLVAVNPQKTVMGVKILAMKETSGIGTKTADEAFLSKFFGKTGGIKANESGNNSIDTISGATISSKAVLSGINEALDAVGVYIAANGTEGN